MKKLILILLIGLIGCVPVNNDEPIIITNIFTDGDRYHYTINSNTEFTSKDRFAIGDTVKIVKVNGSRIDNRRTD